MRPVMESPGQEALLVMDTTMTEREADLTWFRSFVEASRWRFAKTYVESYPHEWTLERWVDQAIFARAILCIERWGVGSGASHLVSGHYAAHEALPDDSELDDLGVGCIPLVPGDQAHSPEEQLCRDERYECYRAFLARLPDNYRAVVVLSELEELGETRGDDVGELHPGNVGQFQQPVDFLLSYPFFNSLLQVGVATE